MPALIQICIVMATIGLLAIAFMTVRMMIRVNKLTEDLSQLSFAMRASAARVDLAADEARALTASLRECVPPVLRLVRQFETVGQRAADLSSTLLDEIEVPVFTAAAAVRGVRSGADFFLKRLMNRFTHRHSQINGGHDHE